MDETKSKQIFEAFEHIQELQKSATSIDMELAKELSFLKREQNYKAIMGFEEATWRQFMNQQELQGIASIYKADRLIKIYDTYIVKLKIPEIDIRGLDQNILERISTIVNKDNIDEWLEKLRNPNIGRADIYRELKYGKVDEATCNHEFEKKTYEICIKCGTRK